MTHYTVPGSVLNPLHAFTSRQTDPCEIAAVVILIFQRQMLRFRKVKRLACSHKMVNSDWNQMFLDTLPRLLNIKL